MGRSAIIVSYVALEEDTADTKLWEFAGMLVHYLNVACIFQSDYVALGSFDLGGLG